MCWTGQDRARKNILVCKLCGSSSPSLSSNLQASRQHRRMAALREPLTQACAQRALLETPVGVSTYTPHARAVSWSTGNLRTNTNTTETETETHAQHRLLAFAYCWHSHIHLEDASTCIYVKVCDIKQIRNALVLCLLFSWGRFSL